MGLDNREQERKNKVITQVSFGGFAGDVSAKDLTDFLARTIGMVWRCRLKTSWTPPDSHLIFDVANTSKNQITDDYKKVEPHAFVHFALERAAKKALKLAGRSELVFNGCALKACVGTDSSYRINTRMKTLPLRFPNATVEIGLMYGRNDFWVGWKGPDRGIDFELDPFDGCCRFSFTRDAMFSIKDSNRHAGIKCDFKVEFLVREIRGVSFYTDTAPFSMVMHLGSPPWIYYRTADDDIFILDGVTFPLLDDEDCWIRTTDFTDSRAISRCNTYRVSFPPRLQHTMEKVMDYLKERRILEEQPNHPLKIRWEPGFGETMKDFFFCLQHKEGISFELLFLVNCLVHNGIVNQHQLSEEFFDLLRSQMEIVNTAAIRHMYSYKRPVFNACRRLKTVQEWLLKTPSALKIPKVSDDYVEVRKVVITPTRAYCLPPEVELSNRVLRRYKHVADRFLRVTFMDEGFQKLNNNALSFYGPLVMKDTGPNSSNKQRTNIFTRVKMMLEKGFSICGRKYTFLAFSSNQLRDSSAWFFAEEAKITVPSIIKWMGKFDNKIVAKCAARMGQCFSSSYATINVPTEEAKEILDIKRNGHTFSDGIGMITPELAMEVAEKLQLTVNPPSGYQIRYAGCKGVLASWPGIGDGKIKLFWRDSMSKFKSTHTMLEICSWTRFQPGFLNRQIITLLSSLGVQDGVFSKMQNSMIFKLNQMLEDTDVAFEVLTTSCSAQGNTAAIMLSAGFMPHSEPHLRGLLSSIRLGQLGDLLAKSRIFVPQSRWLIGVMDESGKLEYGQCFIQVSIPSLECCFHRHGSRFSGTKKNIKVITGTVAIAKNPCLHPGDIRILEAVDAPDLHHLVDCLVFPQKGDRPHANEASGSDLDGDIYFVTWDDSLIPPSRVSETPMDYTPAEARFLPRTVELQDIITFFTKNIVNDSLGKICNAHVVHADLCETGAQDEKCKKLAELAAKAVDFPKTGAVITMDPELKPKVYPDFMGKDDFMSYKSDKILGKLYRDVKYISEDQKSETEELTSEEIPYDLDLEIPGSEDFISEAWNNKCIYDRQIDALLGQYKVSTESEVVTGHVWSMPKLQSRKLGDIKERLINAYSALKKEFRRAFENLSLSSQELTEDERNELYEQKASAWYQVTYHPRWVKKAEELRDLDGDGGSVRLSFAWITADYLARIKIRRRDRDGISKFKPIDSLAGYLVNKI